MSSLYLTGAQDRSYNMLLYLVTMNFDNIKQINKNQKNKKGIKVLVITALLFIILDQFTKIWVSRNLLMYQPIYFLGDYLRLTLVHNYGLVWGIPFKNNFSYYILPVLGIGVVLLIAFKATSRYQSFTYGMILAGAIGNLIDRVRLGYVIDFIDMGIKNLRWPTYNIADMSIVIGIVLVIINEIVKKKSYAKNIS